MNDQIMISVSDLQEAAVALKAISAYREGRWAEPDIEASSETYPPIVQYLRAALNKTPMNAVKHALLDALLASAQGTWVPYPDLVAAVIKAGATTEADGLNRTQAALRDLSWQVREAVPASYLTGLTKPIEALADRSRSGKDIQYRLTEAGRQAVREVIS